MLTSSLGDGAELRPLEPWQAGEFAAAVERDRAHLAPWLPWARTIVDGDRVRELSRVEWLAVSTNARSIATARRLGMTREGPLRSAVPGEDGRQNLEIWAIVNDPQASRAAPPPAGR